MISLFYGGILGLLYIQITMDVVKNRRKYKISLGSGANDEISSIVSAHLNFASYVPFFLLLLFLIETYAPGGDLVTAFIHLNGILLVIGRIFHYLAFQRKMNFRLRKIGMYLTLMPFIGLSILGILNYFWFLIT